MSGGSMGYLFQKVLAADFYGENPMSGERVYRSMFRNHLEAVAEALRAIEWNDSGDGDAKETEKILKCLGAKGNANLQVELNKLQDDINALRGAYEG